MPAYKSTTTSPANFHLATRSFSLILPDENMQRVTSKVYLIRLSTCTTHGLPSLTNNRTPDDLKPSSTTSSCTPRSLALRTRQTAESRAFAVLLTDRSSSMPGDCRDPRGRRTQSPTFSHLEGMLRMSASESSTPCSSAKAFKVALKWSYCETLAARTLLAGNSTPCRSWIGSPTSSCTRPGGMSVDCIPATPAAVSGRAIPSSTGAMRNVRSSHCTDSNTTLTAFACSGLTTMTQPVDAEVNSRRAVVRRNALKNA
mmetsp:Transcript_26384/g.63564  ORF Transcript_26384/g.63564 Transcript_26384/m.63564 type:complete len:257 (+) Transcript_26384:483-1253(+)